MPYLESLSTYEIILTLLMIFNMGLAMVGVLSGIRATRLLMRVGVGGPTIHMMLVAVVLCATFIGLDLMWYWEGFDKVTGFWIELAWRGWQIIAVGFATLVCCEQVKCTITFACPRKKECLD